MAVHRMDNVGIVVEDLDAVVGFFEEIGLEVEGRMLIDDDWARAVVGLDDMRCEIVMMRMSDGHGKLELAHYLAPAAIASEPTPAPPNTLGMRRIMFAVDDIRDTVDRLTARGGELIGEIGRFEDIFLLCYFRGPEGLIVGLAEELT